jgi:LPXTG-motif cell wall-anchored protein
VTGQGIVVIGANGNTIHVEGAVDVVQSADDVLPLTGSSSMPVLLTGIVSVVSGALALTFKRRRRLHR